MTARFGVPSFKGQNEFGQYEIRYEFDAVPETDGKIMQHLAFIIEKGTIILVEAVTLARNRHLTKQEIERDILHTLGQKKIIWLKEGLAEDPHQVKNLIGNYYGFGTGGHVDEFCRFTNDSTILLCWVWLLPASASVCMYPITAAGFFRSYLHNGVALVLAW